LPFSSAITLTEEEALRSAVRLARDWIDRGARSDCP
jgi:hypothetical protein